MLAKIQLDRNDFQGALDLLKRAVDIGSERAPLHMAPLGHFILADVYNRQGRFGDAERELRTAQRLQSY